MNLIFPKGQTIKSYLYHLYNVLSKFSIVGDGKTIRVTTTGSTVTVSAILPREDMPGVLPGGGSTETKTHLAKVVSGSSKNYFSVEIYDDGPNSGRTDSGTAFVSELFYGDTIPTQSWVIVHDFETPETGGDE